MGVFDFVNVGISWVDGNVLSPFHPLAKIIFWALVVSVITMFFYKKLSDQNRIMLLSEVEKRIKAEIRSNEDDFDKIRGLSFKLIKTSLRKLLVVFFPVVLSSVPAIFVLLWVSDTYGTVKPEAGQLVEVVVIETDSESNEYYRSNVLWPEKDEPLTVLGQSGDDIVVIDGGVSISSSIYKKNWWNFLFSNSSGYIPHHSTVESVGFVFQDREYISFGPEWARGWEMPFFLVIVLISLLIKVVFRIH